MLRTRHKEGLLARIHMLDRYSQQIRPNTPLAIDVSIALSRFPNDDQERMIINRVSTLEAYLTESPNLIPALEEEFQTIYWRNTSR
jgi:hypothetical protein